jgi:UDP-N-acetylglucosamine:LPS N-acetylglucosamine transferase
MPTIVSRNNVTVVNGPSRSASVYVADKPAKKRSRLDKFKMLFTGGSSASKENKRPSSSARAQYNSSDPESYTSSLRKRYNVFTGTDNVSTR